MQAGRDAQPLERPLLLEAGADRPQHGHVPVGPLDAHAALAREAQVPDVTGDRGIVVRGAVAGARPGLVRRFR